MYSVFKGMKSDIKIWLMFEILNNQNKLKILWTYE